MQTPITILIVLGAVAYVVRQWMPATWRAALLHRSAPQLPADPNGTCSTCATCPGCAKG